MNTGSIRTKLFFWYTISIVSVAAFFYLAIHVFNLPYGNWLFLILLVVLALEGLFIIRKMISGLTKLSSKIKTITSKNLSEKVTGIDTQDEIGELAESFNQLLARLDEAFSRERQFIGDVAHELKTPVATLKSSIELALSKKRTSQQYQEALSDTLIDIDRLTATIKNILDLAWLGAEHTASKDSHFDISNSLYELTEIAVKLSAQKHINFKSNIESRVTIFGAKDKISRAVLNVIDNAIKYTKAGGSVSLSLHKKNHQAVIEVTDTGIGISKKDLPHIFNRFYRGSKTAKTIGSGLGLAIAQGIVIAHHGEISISSSVGKGTKVTISLPFNDRAS